MIATQDAPGAETGVRAARSPGRAWSIHVIADSDTRWKWGAALGARLAGPPGRPTQIHGHLLLGRATPSQRQVADVAAGCASLRRVLRPDAVADPAIARADVVVLACVGGTVQAMMHGLTRSWAGGGRRPVVITGYVGLVYERMVDGLLLRAGADVIVANSAQDAARFRSVFGGLGIDPAAIVQSALPFLGGPRHDPGAAGRDRPFTVCVVSQPSVPARRDERRFLLGRVFAHAERHPERRVIVKLRGRPGEQTTHIERHHLARLAAGPARPANVSFVYGAMSDALDETDLCVTVSSTAALEAMNRAIPTAVLTDFGIRESLGNHLFLRSGCLASWTDLDDGAVPRVDPGWAAANGVSDLDPYDAAADRVRALSQECDLPPLRPWYDPVGAAGYLPRLLARNGFDVEGGPLLALEDRPARGAGALRRRIARTGARSVYRLGVHHVEPAVRRWAQL